MRPRQSQAFETVGSLRGVYAERSEVLVMTFSCFVAVGGTAKQGKQPDSIPTSRDSARNDRHLLFHFLRDPKKKMLKCHLSLIFWTFFQVF